jgi:hypothetical protein
MATTTNERRYESRVNHGEHAYVETVTADV